jgi:glycine cleavage system H protein
MTTQVPENLRYTKDHEWLRLEENSTVTLGITEHAQAALGELVFVELPETGGTYTEGDPCAVVESVKAASDVYSPLAGEVTAVNEALADEPELVNSSPYEEGWLLRLNPESADALDELMSAEDYNHFLESFED